MSPKPENAPSEQNYPMRLQKFLARSGVASRRRSEELISAGRVEVNGEIFCARTRKVGKDLWMGFIVPSKAMNR